MTKLTIESSGGTYTAEFAADCIDEVATNLKHLLVCCGYHPETVDQVFNTECRWYDDDTQQLASQTEPFHHPLLNKQID